MPKSPILGGFSVARVSGAADNDLINMAVEVTETKDGKVPGFLYLMSGLDLVVNVGSGPFRGALQLGNNLYVVSGHEVWNVASTMTKVLVGVIGDQDSPVSMFQNGKQLMIVDGVGAWLVPGGLPLTGGTITSAGQLYAVNDEVTLNAATGFQSSFPIIRIASIADHPVTAFRLPNAGSGYTTATAVATTVIQPQPGRGTGLKINITSVAGIITGTTLNAGGVDYATGDTGIIRTGSEDAVYLVTGQAAGVVTTFILLNQGSAYAVVTGAATSAIPGDLPPNLGTGFTVDISAAGAIASATIHNGGHGFVIGATGRISGGGNDATYLINQVGENGTVTGFTFVQGGAIESPAGVFSQRVTTGSGSGLVLTSPTYGTHVGLVPVTVPFPNPIVGDMSDGFGLLVFLGQPYLAASEQLDLSTWPPLSYGVSNQSPDNCIGLHVLHNEAYVQKTDNTEVWVNQGLANFPFGPLSGVHMEVGSMAPFSAAVADEELIWLSRNDQGQGVVVAATAYRPKPISTQALVAEFGKYPNLGDAIAYVRQEGQHTFYVITFPEANATWAYDKTTSELVGYPIWSKLAAFEDGVFNRHWGNGWTPWTGSGRLQPIHGPYQPQGILFSSPTRLATTSGLANLPTSFAACVFSVWVDLSDIAATGIDFSNQGVSIVPGLEIVIEKNGAPQVIVGAWDVSANPIVVASFQYTNWDTWVNFLISIDTATSRIQCWASTLVGGLLVEEALTPQTLTWSSNNPIAPSGAQPFKLTVLA